MSKALISIFITNLGKYNEGELVGEWVDLPITDDELSKVLKRVSLDGQYEELFLSDWESEISEVANSISEYSSIKDLNALANKLQALDDIELEMYQAMLEASIYQASNVNELIDLTTHLDEMTLLDEIKTDEDLGQYFFEEVDSISDTEKNRLQWYINYERYGKDIDLDLGGSFTSYGYLY